MQKNFDIKDFLRGNWLVLLIAAQPLLDWMAFAMQDDVATLAGYIRLAIMVALPLYLLLSLQKKRGFILAMAAIGLYCALHAANCYRLGYISMFFDIAYMARVMQTPILAVCFCYLIKDEQTKTQAVRGILIAAGLVIAGLLLSWLSGTANSTYGDGIGISGWVIDDNRCAHSILLVSVLCFVTYAGVQSERRLVKVLLPVLVALLLITNGTKSCYGALFVIFAAFAVFLVFEKLVHGTKLKTLPIVTMLCLCVAAVLVYPYSPRAEVDNKIAEARERNQAYIDGINRQLTDSLLELGYELEEIEGMSAEEKYDNPVVREAYAQFYYDILYWGFPEMIDRFGMDKVLKQFNMTNNAAVIIDTREVKLANAALIWNESDTLTRLVGFEVTNIGTTGKYDMENDWPAMKYYYGYLGLGLYLAFVLFFCLLILKRLIQDFKGSFTLFNFMLMICLLLQIGLAQYTGAILRRPNVSIYMSLVLALIYYQTVRLPIKKELK